MYFWIKLILHIFFFLQPMQFWVPVISLACQHLPFPLQASLYQIPLQPNLKKKLYAKYGLHHLVTIFHFCERKCACCIHFFLFGCYKNISKIGPFWLESLENSIRQQKNPCTTFSRREDQRLITRVTGKKMLLSCKFDTTKDLCFYFLKQLTLTWTSVTKFHCQSWLLCCLDWKNHIFFFCLFLLIFIYSC